MNLRRATAADAEFLLALRNDADTVKASLQQRPVDPFEHARWLDKTLNSTNVELYIAEIPEDYGNVSAPIGMGRLVVGAHDAEISVAVAPKYRTDGMGTELIRLLVARARELGKIAIAQIRAENAPSLVAFLKAGMVPEGEKVWMRTR